MDIQFTDVCFITNDVLRLREFYEAVFGGKAEGDEIHSGLTIGGVTFVLTTLTLLRKTRRSAILRQVMRTMSLSVSMSMMWTRNTIVCCRWAQKCSTSRLLIRGEHGRFSLKTQMVTY